MPSSDSQTGNVLVYPYNGRLRLIRGGFGGGRREQGRRGCQKRKGWEREAARKERDAKKESSGQYGE